MVLFTVGDLFGPSTSAARPPPAKKKKNDPGTKSHSKFIAAFITINFTNPS
jgi:hypothetical protein